MSNSNKDKIISDIYFDRSGFGSQATTFKDAKAKDKSITLADVKAWFEKNLVRKRPMSGFNSFIAPYAHYEYQIDLFFITNNDLENQKFRIGLVIIDIFSKFAVVVPIKSKQPPDLLAGIMEGINKMGKKPELIYSDEEGSLNSGVLKEYFDKEKIETHQTRTHPAFAERFIRTFKNMLFKRVEADEKKGKDNIQWTDYIFEIMITYNNKMVHSSTDLTPKEAKKPENELKVKANIAMNATKTRKYPDLEKGDKVKIFKKKDKLDKERKSSWQDKVHTISKITTTLGQKYYHLEGQARPYLRHELLKV